MDRLWSVEDRKHPLFRRFRQAAARTPRPRCIPEAYKPSLDATSAPKKFRNWSIESVRSVLRKAKGPSSGRRFHKVLRPRCGPAYLLLRMKSALVTART